MSNLSTIVSFFKSKGVPDYIIAGIVGNLDEESGFDPTNPNPSEGAIGLAQWEGNRRTALEAWARQHGGSPTDLNTQLSFLWHEMNTSESSAWAKVQTARTPAEAAALWDQYYERSSGSTRQQRIAYAVQFAQTGHINNGDYTNTGGGYSPSGESATKLTGNDYGTVDSLGSLLDSVPELRQLVDHATSANWSLDKFQNAVEDSTWWKSHSQTAREQIIERANDPATWNQSLGNNVDSLRALAHQLGFNVNAAQLQNIARSAMLSGNDGNQQWLTEQLGRLEDYSHVTNLGSLQGGMANTAQQLQQLAGDYGYKWTPSEIAVRAQGILTGQTTIDTYKQRLQTWAASTFPSLRKEIENGVTVKDLADPYVSSMSQLLEVDPGTLSVYTPLIRQAMQGTVPAGAKEGADPQATPLWKFEQQVRSDPRWAHTNNAKTTMSQALLQIGSVFGFGPTG